MGVPALDWTFRRRIAVDLFLRVYFSTRNFWQAQGYRHMGAHHLLSADAGTVHRGTFDAAFPAVLTMNSGDTVEITSLSGDRADLPVHRAGRPSG